MCRENGASPAREVRVRLLAGPDGLCRENGPVAAGTVWCRLQVHRGGLCRENELAPWRTSGDTAAGCGGHGRVDGCGAALGWRGG